MRHRRSLSPEYFEGMFAKAADPWGFETSPYETAKYDHTLAALSDRRYRQGFEIGCANGVLTRRLAAICDHLLAIDVSLTALSRARAHCAAHPNVRLERMVFPHDTPSDPGFDHQPLATGPALSKIVRAPWQALGLTSSAPRLLRACCQWRGATRPQSVHSS